MVSPAQIMQLSPRAFWDVDMSKMDYNKNADYIIRKVFERGTLEDAMEVLAYYGEGKVIEALTTAPSLRHNTFILASKLFHLPLSSFKCYTTALYRQIY